MHGTGGGRTADGDYRNSVCTAETLSRRLRSLSIIRWKRYTMSARYQKDVFVAVGVFSIHVYDEFTYMCEYKHIYIRRTEEINQKKKKKNKIPIVATRQCKDVGNNKTRSETYGNAASRRCRVARARVYTIGRRVGGGLLVEYNIVISLLCLSAANGICVGGKGFVFSVVKKKRYVLDQTRLTFYTCVRQTRGSYGVLFRFAVYFVFENVVANPGAEQQKRIVSSAEINVFRTRETNNNTLSHIRL